MPKTAWGNKFPQKEELKKDIQAIIDSFLKIFLRKVDKKDIKGIYVKGSSIKQWDSIIDYVPELSDVDIHIELKNGITLNKNFNEAMRFSLDVEDEFIKNRREYVHFPNLQIRFIDSDDEFLPSPKSSVKNLIGVYKEKSIDASLVKGRDIDGFNSKNKEFLENIPSRLMYKHRQKLINMISEFSWRISSAGPLILVLKGINYEIAWSINRTKVLMLLRDYKEIRLANNYENFYYNCWKHYLSKDEEYVREAIICGYNFLKEACNFVDKNTKIGS